MELNSLRVLIVKRSNTSFHQRYQHWEEKIEGLPKDRELVDFRYKHVSGQVRNLGRVLKILTPTDVFSTADKWGRCQKTYIFVLSDAS